MAGQLFEMKIDTAKMKKMAKALEINSQVMPELKTNNPPLGCFTADIGPMNQYIQFYMYKSYGARETEMMNLGYQDPNWASANNSLRELYDSQETVTLRLAKSFEKIQRPAQPGGYYFLYKFKLMRSGVNTYLNQSHMETELTTYIKNTNMTALGMWTAELGGETLSTYYVLFHSDQLDSPSNPALAHEHHRFYWKALTRSRYVESISGQMLRPAPWGNIWR